jgi:hypothetical protein
LDNLTSLTRPDNPFGKLKSGFALVRGCLASIHNLNDSPRWYTDHETNCKVVLNDGCRIRAKAEFNNQLQFTPQYDPDPVTRMWAKDVRTLYVCWLLLKLASSSKPPIAQRQSIRESDHARCVSRLTSRISLSASLIPSQVPITT